MKLEAKSLLGMQFIINLGTETVSIFVGPIRKQYTIHKDLVCNAVPFFSKTFEGVFHEAQSGAVHLTDDHESPAAFELFIHWLYTGVVPAVPMEDKNLASWESIEINGVLATLMAYHELYYIAEK
ncbi:hypothetical protein MMC26_006037 [Xylographa opegraphella]|nr:hypothetical protein [Xylographa opegraphella]